VTDRAVATKPRILLVDDEPNVLEGLRLQLARRYEVDRAESGPAGLEILSRPGPSFAVVCSDMRMPDMDGAEFLSLVRDQYPDTARILLTGFADIEAALAAINDAQVFRFLSKPCDARRLLEAFEAAAEHSRLKRAEKELLEQTLVGAVGVLGEVLALVNPDAFGCASRIRRTVRAIWERFDPEGAWQADIATQLCQIGLVNSSGSLLQKIYGGEALTPEEQSVFDGHASLARTLIQKIPRLEHVAECVAMEYSPDSSADLPIGARILQVVLEYDRLVMSGASPAAAVSAIKNNKNNYDAAVLAALEQESLSESERTVELLALDDLEPGMSLDAPVQTSRGVTLVGAGQELTASLIDRIGAFDQAHGVRQPLTVRLARPAASGWLRRPQEAPAL